MRLAQNLADFSLWIWPLLANHLWQATLFALFAFGVAALLVRGPARARQYVWLMASAKLALPTFALISLAGVAGLDRSEISGTVEPAHRLVSIPQTVDRVAAPFRGPRHTVSGGVPVRDSRRDACSLLTLLWVAGALATAIRWSHRRRVLSQDMKLGRTILAGRETAALTRAKLRTGSARPVALVVSRQIVQPGVHGVLRPVVVLPEGIADRLSDAELEAVFVHELVHVRRWDNLLGNLHMGLCCLFWFYPIVWLLDRRWLVERERVCDDEVLRLSGTPSVYASSLLKVCKFCLGPRVAGVSAATGTGMRERVTRIVAHRSPTSLTLAHRAIIGTAALTFILFVVAGLLGANVADSLASVSPSSPEAPGLEAPAAGLAQERVDAVRPVVISFENEVGAPIVIRTATARIVPLDSPETSGKDREVLVTPPTLTLDNASEQRVVFVRVEFGSESRWNDTVGFPVAIEPNGSYLLQPDWRSWSNTVRAGETGRLVARVVGVRFENGDAWSSLEKASQTPDASSGASDPARFENPSGAPVIIADARTPRAPSSRRGESRLPVVTLTNTTRQRITHLKLRFKANAPAHAVSAFAADIAPLGTYVFRSNSLVDGDSKHMHVQLLGVRFEDGTVWGAFDTTIDTRDPTVSVPQYIHRPDR